MYLNKKNLYRNPIQVFFNSGRELLNSILSNRVFFRSIGFW